MNRETFEMYCWEHGWKIYHILGNLCASKDYGNGYGAQVSRRFEIGINLSDMLREMKVEDGYTEETQGMFPFATSDELPM